MSRHDRPRDDSIEARALRRVRRKLRFFWHLLIFVLVNAGLWGMHLVTGHPRSPVFLWGWALGLAIHGVMTLISLQGEGLRERMLREEIERKIGRASCRERV